MNINSLTELGFTVKNRTVKGKKVIDVSRDTVSVRFLAIDEPTAEDAFDAWLIEDRFQKVSAGVGGVRNGW